MKKWLSTIALIVLAVYVVVAAVAFTDKPADQVCKGVKLEIADSTELGYLNTADILAMLSKEHLDPTGIAMEKLSLHAIEEALNASPLISKSECYKTLGGYVGIRVSCRRPILRILTNGGESYYLDEEGELIEHISKAVYLPVATGYISREFAQSELLALAQYLQSEKLWNAQVGQIYVNERQEIELVPRVGDHTIVLGRPGNYAYKFDKLRTFYEKGLNQVGWNRYSRINLDYSDQVLGTRRN